MEHELKEDFKVYQFGKNSDSIVNDFDIQEKEISAKHLTIEYDYNFGWLLEDHSETGTYLHPRRFEDMQEYKSSTHSQPVFMDLRSAAGTVIGVRTFKLQFKENMEKYNREDTE